MPIARFITLAFAGLSLTLNTGLTNSLVAPIEFVYEVRAYDCKAGPMNRSQTGFRVHGMKGIVTALHGVANCGKVKVEKVHGLLLNSPLSISSVDVERDVALLTSEELSTHAADGLEPLREHLPDVNWASLGPLRAIGHPYGISLLVENVAVRSEPVVNLRALVPDGIAVQMERRRSPKLSIQVISLTGEHLLPGHSGAPIIDQHNRVIGVADGGLERGFAGISWAIPISDIQWESRSTAESAIARLAYSDAGMLFQFDRVPADGLAGETAEAFWGLMLPATQTTLKVSLHASSDVDESVARLALRDEFGLREYSADEQVRPAYLLAITVVTRSVATLECSSAMQASLTYRLQDLIFSKEISSAETRASACVIEDIQKATHAAVRAAVSSISVDKLANQIRANSS